MEEPDSALRLREQAWQQTHMDASLVPDSPKMGLILRYGAVNDRKICMLCHLLAQHCGQAA